MTQAVAGSIFGLALGCGVILAATAILSRRATRRLDRKPLLAALAVAAISMGVSAGMGNLFLPMPCVHDEFSYLLAGDTFANGRLANPTPPLPEHFETMHVLATPTYASKYPPGQGLVLALGQVLFGLPIAGVWLAYAAACAAMYWAMAATLPRRFALAGALLAALHPSMQGSSVFSWTQTFWGGGVALLGAALLFGAAARLAKRARPLDGLALGAGLGILALSRPMEGLIAAALASYVPIRAIIRGRAPAVRDLARRAAPLAALAVGSALAFQGILDYRVTGSVFRMPYAVYEARYASVPILTWMKPPPVKTYGNESMKLFTEDEAGKWRGARTAGFRNTCKYRVGEMAVYFVIPLTVAWIGLPFALRSRRARHVSILLALGLFWSFNLSWYFPHYLAALVPLFIEMAARSVRGLALLDRPWRWGVRIAIVGMLGWMAWNLSGAAHGIAQGRSAEWWPAVRPATREKLEATGTQHLIIVDRRKTWNVHCEFVYNNADFNTAAVLWARSLGDERDRELIQKFPGRTPWRFVLEGDTAKLEPWAPVPK